ncbi:MAG: type II secretion system F family protein [Chthoniobacterales bacterium]|jgi:type II secretory pathway component PulF|nr:type II secretion system F family protein [Chthoniobacterales bacterium]
MPVFAYQALQPGGGKASGEIEALSRQDAFNRLRQQNLQPFQLAMKGAGAAAAEAKPSERGENILSRQQVLLFTEELCELLEAGLKLDRALQIIEQREDKSVLRNVAASSRRSLREGATFSAALKNASPSFSELYCNMVKAGEVSGTVSKILKRQVEFLTMMGELQRRVTSALIYPSVIFAAGIGLLVIFMTFLLPQLTMMLTKTGKTLPVATRALIAVSDFCGSYWWVMIIVLATGVLAFRHFTSAGEGRAWWDKTKLFLPGVGQLLRMRFYAQFTQTLSTLLNNGVSLMQSMQLIKNATPNVYLQGLLDRVTENVQDGAQLSRAVARVKFFPPTLIDIVQVGETTGDLGAALERSAKNYDKQLSVVIERVTALIQPMVIVMVALFVGLVAYSMITGIMQTVSGLPARR